MFLATTTIFAQQKYGHINSAVLLPELPAWQAAQTTMETFRGQIEADYKAKIEDYQQQVKVLEDRVQVQKNITEQEIQMEQQRLMEVEQSIAQFEAEAQQKMMKKEEELVAPIFDQVKAAIKAVAEENGYTYIFDLSVQGAIVYSIPEGDVTELVKAKL